MQFTRVIRASEKFYPLIDDINFKGEGTNPNEAAVNRETGRRHGWGLKQLLLRMNGDTNDPKAVRAEFADAAQAVLQQRARNLPSNRVSKSAGRVVWRLTGIRSWIRGRGRIGRGGNQRK